MAKIVRPREGQTIFDLALENTGDIRSAIEIAVLNGYEVFPIIFAGDEEVLVPQRIDNTSVFNGLNNAPNKVKRFDTSKDTLCNVIGCIRIAKEGKMTPYDYQII